MYRGTNPKQLYIDGLGAETVRVEKDLQGGNLSGSQTVSWGSDLDNETIQNVESVSGFISSTYLSITVKSNQTERVEGQPEDVLHFTHEFNGATD